MKNYNLVFNFKFYPDFEIHPLEKYAKMVAGIIFHPQLGKGVTLSFIDEKEGFEKGGLSFVGEISKILFVETVAYGILINDIYEPKWTDKGVEDWVQQSLNTEGMLMSLYEKN